MPAVDVTTDDLANSMEVPDAFAPSPVGLDAATPVGLDPVGSVMPTSEPLSLDGKDPITPPTEGFTPSGSGSSALRDRIITQGMQYLGMPYKWGGASPKTSFDCSGLVQYVYGRMGISLPRISYQQANYGHKIGLDQLRPGDLVAWDENSRNNGADHIAIYIGGGRILEAPHTGANVRVRKLGASEGAWGVAMNLPGDK